MTDSQESQLVLSLSSEGVRFLRAQWLQLRGLVRWQLENSSTDSLAELTGLPVLTVPLDERLACVVDFWCGTDEQGPLRRLWEGWLLQELEHALSRTLATLPRCGGVVTLPDPGHPTIVEWGCMLATLYVVLEAADRTPPSAPPHRGSVPPSAADTNNHRRSLEWLELVLETLADAGKPAPVRTT